LTSPHRVDSEYLMSWREFARDSPLYFELAGITAETPELLAVIRRIHNEPPPNVFLAAIQYMLLHGLESSLRSYYGSIVDDPLPPGDVANPFNEFVIRHQDRIVAIANSRYTQTNECRRCVALLPAVMASPFEAFHLFDLGTSAGLNLAMDQYRYELGGVGWGPESSRLTLVADVRGDAPRLREVRVMSRTGIDLNVLDPTSADDRMWLEALIWPEHQQRRQRLRSALEIAARVPRDLVEGDILEMLGGRLNGLPAGEPVVIINSFVLNQFDPDQRSELADLIDSGRKRRRIFRVSLEALRIDDRLPRLEVGEERDLVELGTAHHHGEWIDLSY
jgi:hypothetical protein